MLRKAVDVGRSDVPKEDVTARMTDTYARPDRQDAGSLESIAAALQNVNPKIALYLNKQKAKKEDFDMAAGAALYRKFVANNQDLSAKEIEDQIKAGNVEGFRNLNHWQKQGIIRARYEVANANIQEHMQTWWTSADATVTDDQGNKVPLSSIKDQSKAMLAFETEAERYIRQVTGGYYDPNMYEEFLSIGINTAREQFIQSNANKVRDELTAEHVSTATKVMDATASPLILSNEAVKNPANFANTLSATLTKQVQELQAYQGMSKQDALNVVSQWIQSKFADTSVNKECKDGFLAVAQQIPDLMADPKAAEVLYQSYNSGVHSYLTLNYMLDASLKEKEKASIDDFLSNYALTGVHDPKAVAAFVAQHPKNAIEIYQNVNALNTVMNRAYESEVSMDPERYTALLTKYRQGGGSMAELRSVASQLDSSQWNELTGEYADTARRAVKAGSHAAGVKQKATEVNKFIKLAQDVLPADKKKQVKDKSNAGTSNLLLAVARDGYVAFQAYKETHPKAGKFELIQAQDKCMREAWQQDNRLDNFNYIAANPDEAGKSGKQITRDSLKTTANNLFGKLNASEAEKKQFISSLDGPVSKEQVDWFLKHVSKDDPNRNRYLSDGANILNQFSTQMKNALKQK